MSTKKTPTKKKAKAAKVAINDLESAKDPKGGLNFAELSDTSKPKSGQGDPVLGFSWGVHKGG